MLVVEVGAVVQVSETEMRRQAKAGRRQAEKTRKQQSDSIHTIFSPLVRVGRDANPTFSAEQKPQQAMLLLMMTWMETVTHD